jgi:hypothetical protein
MGYDGISDLPRLISGYYRYVYVSAFVVNRRLKLYGSIHPLGELSHKKKAARLAQK